MRNESAVLNALQTIPSSTKQEAVFAALDTKTYSSLLRQRKPQYWQEAGAQKALNLFHQAAKRVPAYKDFLKKANIRPAHITTVKDFSKVPVLTKENYIQEYPLAARSWDGVLEGHALLALSSGTSGKPTIWPRGAYQESEAAFIHEFLLTDLYEINKYKTLVVVGFPMGMYVSGVATSIPLLAVASKHTNISIVTAGNNKESVLSILKTMMHEFEQVILVGHPFFIKDVIETGTREEVAWTTVRVRAFFCSEGFNEVWRSYVALQAGVEPQALLSSYGSSEFLLMAHENPFTVAIRKEMENDSKLCEKIFHHSRMPNLFQYNPLLRFIEVVEGDLVTTAAAGIPLVRFNQHDMGATFSYETMIEHIGNLKSLQKYTPWQLPFVTLSGRSDRTLIFYAANVYPEHVQAALNHREYVSKVTGKFFMEKRNLPDMEQELLLHIELRPQVRGSKLFEVQMAKHIFEELRNINMEYRDASSILGHQKAKPTIILHAHGDPSHFKPGVKPRFI